MTPGPAIPRLLVSVAIGAALLAVLIGGINMVADAVVRQAEIDAARTAKFVVVRDAK